MPRFSYSAVQASGQRTSGAVKCQDRHEALRQLVSKGLHPLNLRQLDQADGVGERFKGFFGRVRTTDLAVFTRQLSSLLKAGLPLTKALNTLGRQSQGRLVQIVEDLEETLGQQGGQLADALDNHPRVFSRVYRSLVRSGEETGNMVEVLNGLAKYLSQSAKLRGQVVSAFVYPVFLLLLGSVAIFVLMTFVIPRFKELFDSFGQALPKPTQILIAFSGFMSSWWWAVLAGMMLAILGVMGLLRRKPVRLQFDRLVLRLPVVGQMILKIEMSRIARTLSALLNGGVGALSALATTGDVARNLAIRVTFPVLIKEVSAGTSLATASQNAKIYPPLMINLVRTGEETGQLPEMLMELSDIYEDEAERAITAAVKLIEPVLIVVMGGVIASIVAGVMLPVFQVSAMVEQ